MISTSPVHTEWPPPRPRVDETPDAPGTAAPGGLVPDGREIVAGETTVANRTPGGASRQMAILAAALLLGAVTVVGVIWYLTGSIAVELTVDGETGTVDTRAGTVAELLADQEVVVTAEDLVTPPPGTELTDDTAVEVRFARPITVTVDGVDTVHTTTELTVGQALAALAAPIDGSAVSIPLDQPLPRTGTAVDIVTPKAITVAVAGQSQTVTTTARTVGDLLAANNITLADQDTVVPPADTALTPDLTVTVTRIRIETEVRTESIPHETEERQDPELTVGTREVETPGVDGSREVTWSITRTDGEITAEEPGAGVVIAEPVTEVVRVGTRPAPTPAVDPGASPGGAAGGLNWAALAQCESSGNPTAVNPAGYYGLYQFSLPTWRSVGGTGNPADASVAEQTERAQILYNRSGAGQWPTCGRLLFT